MRWPNNINDAKEIQEGLRTNVRIEPLLKAPRFIAGVDAAFTEDGVIAAACVFLYPEMLHLEDAHAVTQLPFPYIPGYLAFREGPAILAALTHLKIKPDIMLVDGHGVAHPKGIGIASHIGVLMDLPAIGCAKSRLTGEYEESGPKRGDWAALRYDGEIVGSVLRTRDGVRPLFVSPGHRITLEECREVVLRSAVSYRLPEPLRRADRISRALKGNGFSGHRSAFADA